MITKPKALVLIAQGINCNVETAFAIEQAGGQAEQVHISQLNDGQKQWDDYDILALSGGFSYGDKVRSGAILGGVELRQRHGEALNRFVEAGKAIIGICNGFQVLVESGLLPGGLITEPRDKHSALITNENNTFECRWVHLAVEPSVSKIITPESFAAQHNTIELPVAHREGRFIDRLEAYCQQLSYNGQIPLYYASETGEHTTVYPLNPNGSPQAIAGICDPTGIINGLMPHPERFVNPYQHYAWQRGQGQNPFGAIVFKNLVEYAKEM